MTQGKRRASRASGRLAARAVWAIGDQALSSATNFGLGMFVARGVSAASFGAFSIAFATYSFVLNISNGMISEPFHVRFSNIPIEDWREAAKRATGAAISVGLVAGLVCLTVGLLAGGVLSQAFLALAIVLPVLTVQNLWRATFFARRQGSLSFLNDLAWACALVPALAIASNYDRDSVFALVLAWGCAACVAAAVGVAQARVFPNPLETVRWLRQQWDLAPRYVSELVVYAGAHQITLLTIGAVGGLSVVGGIRGAEIVLGPLYVLTFGIRVMAVPEAVVLLQRSPARMRRVLVILSFVVTGLALAMGVGALAIPGHWGKAILGSTWAATRPALVPMAVFLAASAVSQSGRIGLRALGDARRSLRARLYSMPLVIVCGTVGAAIGGSAEATLGLALGMGFDAVCSWRQLDLALAEREQLAVESGSTSDVDLINPETV